MPVTLTSLGDELNITILDDNVQKILSLLKGALTRDDLSGKFNRFRVHRYVSGRLISSHVFANPNRETGYLQINDGPEDIGITFGIRDFFDVHYRQPLPGFGSGRNGILGMPGGIQHETGYKREPYTMEFLGKPGPSLYYAFQEEGITLNQVNTSIVGSVSLSPIELRHPRELCYSPWMTVWGASTKVYVPHGCVARVTGTFKGTTTYWAKRREVSSPTDDVYRSSHTARFGLIADTNPILYSDEFINTNPNILDPETGLQSSTCSWLIFRDLTRNTAQRELVRLIGEVALAGGRWYNISMKYRDALTHGYVAHDGQGNSAWVDGFWEDNGLLPTPLIANAPIIEHSAFNGVGKPFQPIWVNMVESSALDIEFFYNRDLPYASRSNLSEFTGA